MKRGFLLALAWTAAFSAACGYHVGGHTDAMPATIKTIAIPPIANNTMRPKLPALLASGLTHEFHARTKYAIVSDPTHADAVLKATIAKFVNFPTIADPASGRATGAGCVVTMNVLLTDQHTGKVLFSEVGVEYRERYEISIDPKTYFDESDTALERLSRDLAQGIVTAILEKF
ncbi:MAG TPA: LPS assembly lipoprotein LptE [Bryobacteraceae bacterium]|nr:LPS assembly lipoprotein LptE [Bryobacteraceae bacterium]